MRILKLCDSPIRVVAVSPDGRFVAAATSGSWVGMYSWQSGDGVRVNPYGAECRQFAFTPDGRWVVSVRTGGLWFERLDDAAAPPQVLPGAYAGGVAVSPDGKKLFAVQTASPYPPRLAVWDLPARKPQLGFESGAPCRRIAVSPSGEFIAGIWQGFRRATAAVSAMFEMRYAASGGRDYTYPPMVGPAFDTPGFITFARSSGTCVFGWDGEFHVLDTATGTGRYVRWVEAPVRDAAFTGSGRHLATVGGSSLLKLWDARTWQVVTEYDWQCGPLTCVAFTADGTAGVCGTADGRLVQFDVDE
jgi:WD40 repeat protein